MPITVQTPKGTVEFPDGMADADIERILAADNPAPVSSHEPGQKSERTWTDTAVDALPVIGGALGGIAGAGLGPLAIGTAAIGGAGGEGFRRAINDLRGKGNPESFESCSHGAGRVMSRTQAKKRYTVADQIAATEGVECRKDADVVDEIPMAYKDIDAVMAAQADLVEVVYTLKQVVCVKG